MIRDIILKAMGLYELDQIGRTREAAPTREATFFGLPVCVRIVPDHEAAEVRAFGKREGGADYPDRPSEGFYSYRGRIYVLPD